MKTEKAIFAAGCFWGVEARFRKIPGVLDVQSGYTGGDVADPSYKMVCTGATGHAEAVEVTFDPAVVTYTGLLSAFWKMHDPTTPNRQGPDVGTQYRSIIFYLTPQQKKEAEASKKALETSGAFSRPIVTAILPAKPFYRAEEYHQRYLEKTGRVCG